MVKAGKSWVQELLKKHFPGQVDFSLLKLTTEQYLPLKGLR